MAQIQRYGFWFDDQTPALQIEIEMIRHGGQWKGKHGQLLGMGLAYHFKQFIKIVWPHIKFHKWLDMIVENYVMRRGMVLIGPAASGKTLGATLCVMVDYYCWPECTSAIVCSTTRDRLEERILGEIKKLHRMATDRFPLPGSLIEGKQRIVTHDRDEAKEGRDFRNGIIGVPVLRGNEVAGMGSFAGIHNDRVRLIADELCFPLGTMVDTPCGKRAIEKLRPGDEVLSAIGRDRVIANSTHFSDFLVRIRMNDGREVTCTPNHPFFTQFGWKKACELNEGCFILSTYEAMRVLRDSVHFKIQPQRAAFLQSVLLLEVRPFAPTRGTIEKNINSAKTFPGAAPRLHATISRQTPWFSMAHGKAHCAIKHDEGQGHKTSDSWGQWTWTDKGRSSADENVSGSGMEFSGENWETMRQRLSDQLQSGHRIPGDSIGCGSRWFRSQQSKSESQGRQEGWVTEGAWVESVEVLEQTDPRFSDSSSGSRRCRVCNLRVEGHPSFSVNGFLVHNSLLPRVVIDSVSNLDKCPDFKFVGLGNPKETTDALGVMAEPAPDLGGWDGGIDQTPVTKFWRCRRPDTVCLQFVGSDSPNLDGKLGIPLLTQAQIDRDVAFYGKESLWYSMMNQGMMPRGQGARRVITRQLCVKHHALESPLWLNENRTRIAGLDAAYRGVGGDRCVFCHMEFGLESEAIADLGQRTVENLVNQTMGTPERRMIIALIETLIVPLKPGEFDKVSPEDQIVAFVRAQCDARNIPPEHFFFDSGMRTSLVSSFSRLWSNKVVPIDCGGRPSERQVSYEIEQRCCDFYSKYISEMWYSVRLAIEAEQFRGMTEDAMLEFCAREYTIVGANKTEVEIKANVKAKTGRSPDLADCVAVALEGARRLGFVIRRLDSADKPKADDRWKWELRKQQRELARSHSLNYAA